MNNSNIPGCDFRSDTCLTNQRKLIGPDQEFVELLWQKGQVVMHSQTHNKPVGNSANMRQFHKTDQSTLRTSRPHGNSSNMDQENSPWIQYPLEDPLEQDFCSNLLPELPPPCEVESYKPIKQFQEQKFPEYFASSTPHPSTISQSLPPMPSPRFHAPNPSQKINDFGASRKLLNFPLFSTPLHVASASQKTNLPRSEAREDSSVVTVGSSHSGSNHIPQDQDGSRVSSSVWATTNNTTTLSAEPEAVRDCVQRHIPSRSDHKGKSEVIEPTMTSSSGGSGSTGIGRTCSPSPKDHGLKRKRTEEAASEEQSEATELKSADGNKGSRRTGFSRRNRAAEVHNLSERRRRDRINEKMRALQQLIPNSNKTDKASMLEEAIEYLKSLQFQLQVMWMGAGMTPLIFPGIQQYMSQMGMGAASLPSIHNPMQLPMQLPKVPHDQAIMSMAQIPNQNLMCQNQVLGAFNYQNQMQNPCLSEQYARYMGYHHLMQSASQPMNALRHGSQGVDHSQTMISPNNNSIGPITTGGTANIHDVVSAGTSSSTFN